MRESIRSISAIRRLCGDLDFSLTSEVCHVSVMSHLRGETCSSVNKVILHLDMDAFFASIEQAIDPRLAGRPLIVGSRENRNRTVVAAASYEAKAYGIESGMSCKEAFRLCPDAEFVPADSSKYLYVSEKIFELLKNFSPQVERSSVDEFYLDITGCERIFTSYENIGLLIKEKVKAEFKITGSVGISESRLFAKIASKLKKPDGFFILFKKDIPKELKDLPIEKIPGIGKALKERLNKLGIFKYSELSKLKREEYYKEFGNIGLWLFAVSRGEDSDKITFYNSEDSPPKSVGHSYTLQKNIYKREELEAWLRLLCEMVGARLRSYRLEAKTIHLFLRMPNLGFLSKQKNFYEPTSDSKELFLRARIILDLLIKKPTYIRALGVSASELSPISPYYLFDSQKRHVELLNFIDTINSRFGEWTIFPASLMRTRLMERSDISRCPN